MVFDLLEFEGRATLELPYRERRRLLESLRLEGADWFMPAHFDGRTVTGARMFI